MSNKYGKIPILCLEMLYFNSVTKQNEVLEFIGGHGDRVGSFPPLTATHPEAGARSALSIQGQEVIDEGW